MSNTINIVQPKAEDGVTEVSFVTRTNSIFKSDGTPLGDSMDEYMNEVAELNSNLSVIKMYADSAQSPQTYRTVNASTIATVDITVPEAGYGFIVGYGIESSTDVCILQIYMSSKTNIHCRVKNLTATNQNYQVRAYYI